MVGFVVYAWTGPTGAPPNNNVDAPINVGTTTQYKSGALGIGGLFRVFSDAIFDGNVSIGTATIKGDGSVSANLNADKLDNLHSADIMRGALFGSVGVWSNGEFFTGPGSSCVCKFSYPPAYCTWIPSYVCSVGCESGYTLIKTSVTAGGAPYSFWSCQKN